MRFLIWFIEFLGWLRIVASPLLLFSIIGACIYFYDPTTTRLIVGLIVSFAGLVLGILWATSIWKKYGTMQFLSRTDATPELDKQEKD
jgi:hypothetical protein